MYLFNFLFREKTAQAVFYLYMYVPFYLNLLIYAVNNMQKLLVILKLLVVLCQAVSCNCFFAFVKHFVHKCVIFTWRKKTQFQHLQIQHLNIHLTDSQLNNPLNSCFCFSIQFHCIYCNGFIFAIFTFHLDRLSDYVYKINKYKLGFSPTLYYQ